MAFIEFNKCFSNPKYILRTLAVVICILVATYQLSECFTKIMHPPVNTLYGFSLNKTMKFPAITLCRNPPYKTNLFARFNISSPTWKPTDTNFWRYFNFEENTIEDFISQTTYNSSEFIRYQGFLGEGDIASNLTISTFISLTLGKCYTFFPVNNSFLWSSNSHYSFMLRHKGVNTVAEKTPRNYDNEKTFSIPSELKTTLDQGFHVYIHSPSEMVSDMQFQDDSFMEYLQVDVGEELKINLRPHEYSQVPTNDNKCQPGFFYSKSRCKEECLRNKITTQLRCQSPWLPNNNYPLCSNFEQLKSMLQLYENPNFDCKCLRSCNIAINKPNIQNRKDYNLPSYSVLYIYYASNLVTQMNQYIAYDWNIFLADLGGSLGFLLGLSVLGVIGVLQSILKFIYKHSCAPKEENIKENELDKDKGKFVENEKSNYFNESKFKEAEASKYAFQNDFTSFNDYVERQLNGHNFLEKY